MTCIIGLEHKGKVWIGGDGVAFLENSLGLRHRLDPKVFTVQEVLFGFTSSFRLGQLLRFSLAIPPQAAECDDFEYLCTDFINAVRECLKIGGFATLADNEEEDQQGERGGFFLIGYKGRLYNIQNDYQVGIPRLPFDALGCGEDYALGSLLTTQGQKIGPQKRITLAFTAATYFSAAVAPPFSIIVSKRYRVPEKKF